MFIEANELTKIYPNGGGEIRALDGVSLGIERGEFVSVIGSSGSGKSTLMHLLGGLDYPTRGKVTIDGVDIFSLKPDKLTIFRRRFIGFVFQSYNLIPELSIYENVTLPLGLDGIKADENEVKELLSTLGIGDRLNSLPCQLSGGQRQRAAIARALITKPHLILADEPTGNLDSKNSLEVTRTLILLNEQFGQTIVLVTHNEELAQMAGRLIRIEDGRIVSDTKGGAR